MSNKYDIAIEKGYMVGYFLCVYSGRLCSTGIDVCQWVYSTNLSVIFIFSRVTETSRKGTEKGLKFIPGPRNIYETEVLADIKKFSRRMRLKEYFHNINMSTASDASNTGECDYAKREFRKPSTFKPKPNREPALDLYLKYLEKTSCRPSREKANLIFPK